MKIIFIALALLTLTPIANAAEKIIYPYKTFEAKTSKECVLEKACFWHHLLVAVQRKPAAFTATDDIKITKWTKPILHRRGGIEDVIDADYTTARLGQIKAVVNQELKVASPTNSFVFIVDDVEEYLKNDYQKILPDPDIVGRYMGFKKANPKDAKCFRNLGTDENKDIAFFFGFIESDHRDIERCYKEMLYSSVGLNTLGASPILLSEDSPKSYTVLESLVLLFLSQKYIRSGMGYDELKTLFDQAYDPFIEGLIEIGLIKK